MTPVVDSHHVRVIQRRGCLGLSPEPLQECGIVSQRVMEDLDGHPASQRHVIGQIDGRGSPGADGCNEAISPTEHLTHSISHVGNGHDYKLVVTPMSFTYT